MDYILSETHKGTLSVLDIICNDSAYTKPVPSVTSCSCVCALTSPLRAAAKAPSVVPSSTYGFVLGLNALLSAAALI